MPFSEEQKLFEMFGEADFSVWEKAFLKDIQEDGKSLQGKLNAEGINIRPIYNNRDSSGKIDIPICTTGNNWEISQEVFSADIKEANKIAHDALRNGADSITFMLHDKTGSRACMELNTQEEFSMMVNNLPLSQNTFRFISGRKTMFLLSLLEKEVAARNISPSSVKFVFDYDPVDFLAFKGRFFRSPEEDFSLMHEITEFASAKFPLSRTIGINGYLYRNAGSSVIQELAFSLAVASDYLSILSDRNLPPESVINQLTFSYGICSEFFMEIAKFRAARFLIHKLISAFTKEPSGNNINIHAVTSDFNKTACDPYNNVLRNTTQAMSAIIGGADSLTIRPHDSVFSGYNTFSSDLGRNIQLLLKNESYLDKVTDIAAGSYFVDNITSEIIEKSWDLFLSIEDSGGYMNALRTGIIQKMIKEIQQKRVNDISCRKEIIIGVNDYPALEENIGERIKTQEIVDKTKHPGELFCEPVSLLRGASGFEELRMETERMKRVPSVLLFSFGNLAQAKARSSFAMNFFGCAGFKTIESKFYVSAEKGLAEVLATKPCILVLCSSDKDYEENIGTINLIIKEDIITVIAGKQKNLIECSKSPLKPFFISSGMNVADTLKQFQDLLKSPIKF